MHGVDKMYPRVFRSSIMSWNNGQQSGVPVYGQSTGFNPGQVQQLAEFHRQSGIPNQRPGINGQNQGQIMSAGHIQAQLSGHQRVNSGQTYQPQQSTSTSTSNSLLGSAYINAKPPSPPRPSNVIRNSLPASISSGSVNPSTSQISARPADAPVQRVNPAPSSQVLGSSNAYSYNPNPAIRPYIRPGDPYPVRQYGSSAYADYGGYDRRRDEGMRGSMKNESGSIFLFSNRSGCIC